LGTEFGAFGSTLPRIAARVTDSTGNVVLAALEPPAVNPLLVGPGLFAVVPDNTDLLVWVQRPAGIDAGTNDFYDTTIYTDVPFSVQREDPDAGTNDTPATATYTDIVVGNTGANLGILTGTLSLPTADPVDYWQVPANMGDKMELFCFALREGSGLRGVNYAFVRADGGVLQSETEQDTQDLAWCNSASDPGCLAHSMNLLIAPSTEIFFLKVTAASQDPVNTGSYYRCTFAVFQ
jgi:hypothetical protein